MATQFSGFFDSSANVTRSYDADALAIALRALGGTGVESLSGGLQVTAEGDTMRTLVAPGLAMINGYVYELQDDGGAIYANTHAASAASPRCDRIVLRLDMDASSVTLAVLSGTPGADATPPELTRTATIYEISLARVLVRASATSIEASDITDERGDESVCGVLAPEGLKLSTLWSRMTKSTATTSADGLMPHADKAYLDSLQAAVTVSANALDLGGKYIDNALFR